MIALGQFGPYRRNLKDVGYGPTGVEESGVDKSCAAVGFVSPVDVPACDAVDDYLGLEEPALIEHLLEEWQLLRSQGPGLSLIVPQRRDSLVVPGSAGAGRSRGRLPPEPPFILPPLFGELVLDGLKVFGALGPVEEPGDVSVKGV